MTKGNLFHEEIIKFIYDFKKMIGYDKILCGEDNRDLFKKIGVIPDLFAKYREFKEIWEVGDVQASKLKYLMGKYGNAHVKYISYADVTKFAPMLRKRLNKICNLIKEYEKSTEKEIAQEVNKNGNEYSLEQWLPRTLGTDKFKLFELISEFKNGITMNDIIEEAIKRDINISSKMRLVYGFKQVGLLDKKEDKFIINEKGKKYFDEVKKNERV